MEIEQPVAQDQDSANLQSKNAKKKAAKKSKVPDPKSEAQTDKDAKSIPPKPLDDSKMAEETKKTKKTPKKQSKEEKKKEETTESKTPDVVNQNTSKQEEKLKKEIKKAQVSKPQKKEEAAIQSKISEKTPVQATKKSLNDLVSSDSEDESDESVKKSQTDYKTCVSNKTKILKSTQISEIKINPNTAFVSKPNTGLALLADESDSDSSESDDLAPPAKKVEPKPASKPVAVTAQINQKNTQAPAKKPNQNLVRVWTFSSDLYR